MAGYIGSKASVVSSGVERKKTYSITGSTTSLTGLNYTVGKVHVYQNGVRLLDGTDYTATNGTSITLTVAAQSGDNVVVVSQASFQLSESYTSTEADAEFVTKTGDTMTGNLSFGDNDQAIFGAGSDLQIYHDGSNSYIRETGTGNLNISADQLRVLNASNNEIKAEFTTDGAVDLYHNNALKLATTATGISVSGTVNATTALFSGYIDFQTGGVNKGNIYTDASTMIINTQGTNTTLNTNGGNVGIGTSSPSTKLSVTGGYISQVNAGVSTYLGEDGSGGSLVGTTSNHYFRFITNNTERMRIDSSGNVGIGTSSPTAALTVTHDLSGSGDASGFRLNSAATSTSNTLFGGAVSSGDYSFFQSYKEGTSAGVRGLSLNPLGGNVGIGTSSPSKKFVVSEGGAHGFEISPYDGSQNATRLLNYNRSTNAYFPLEIEASQIAFETNGSESMRIDSSGNLLVGTTLGDVGLWYNRKGVVAKENGQLHAAVYGGAAAVLNRNTNDGDIVQLRKAGTTIGSIAVNSSAPIFRNSNEDGIGIKTDNGNCLVIPYNSSGASDNDADLGSSSNRFKDAYLSGGVYLGGTGSANKLDDYEEGTFTPSVSVGDASTKIGVYTKVGRLVTIQCRIQGFTNTSNNEVLVIGNLPFTIGQTSKAIGSAMWSFVDTDNAYGVVYAVSGNALAFYSASENNDFDSLRCIDMDSSVNTSVYFSGTYMAT
jgi:hypothetical protein